MVLLKGGNGGFGNTHFKGPVNRAPRHANPGLEGREAWVWLRLKLIADIGLVGLPNAGKSTLLASVSRARPKIADYPFTTLHPNLGVVGVRGREFIMADIPGLIAGASEGAGLGYRFLGHVERCTALLHLVDATQDNVTNAYQTIRHELAAYDDGLANKPEILALTKCDAMNEAEQKTKTTALQAVAGKPVHRISAVTGFNMTSLTQALLDFIDDTQETRRIAAAIKTQATADKKFVSDAGWHPLQGPGRGLGRDKS